MNDPVNSPSPPPAADPHADKYNDPRVRVTPRGIGLLVGIFVVAAIAAVLSIRARSTHLEQSTQFWGDDAIAALQLGDRVTLIAAGMDESKAVDLSGMPGLGHLRRALLDERHYDWSTQSPDGVAVLCEGLAVTGEDADTGKDADSKKGPSCVQLRFADPSLKRFPELRIDLQLDQGIVGPADGSRRVAVTDRVQPALKHQIGLWMNFRQKSYDERN